ncbi:MAG: hypothetical protein ACRY3E_01265 [Candidatus Lariskella arthropodorum]
MANIKTEFYAAIARLQKQLESNSLSKDDKAATEKYIKDTLSTFREKLSSSEQKMSVDDVKALAKEINDVDIKKEDLVNKINTPVKKEEIQDVATNLENLKKEFNALNTQVSNAISAKPSQDAYEKFQSDFNKIISTDCEDEWQSLKSKAQGLIKAANLQQDKISQDVRNQFVNEVKTKSNTCLEKFNETQPKGKKILGEMQQVSDQAARLKALSDKLADINTSDERAGNQLQTLMHDVTNLLGKAKTAVQQDPNVDEAIQYLSKIPETKDIEKSFDNLITKIDKMHTSIEEDNILYNNPFAEFESLSKIV